MRGNHRRPGNKWHVPAPGLRTGRFGCQRQSAPTDGTFQEVLRENKEGKERYKGCKPGRPEEWRCGYHHEGKLRLGKGF